MTKPTLTSCKEDILKKLGQAGAKGLNKTRVGASSRLRKEALAVLERERKIANLEIGNRYLYVLKAFDNPLEMACERIEKKTASHKNTLFSRSKLVKECKKACPGKVRKEFDRAIKWLVDEKKLLKFRYGRYFLFSHVSSVQSLLPSAQAETGAEQLPEQTEESSSRLDRERALRAYRNVRTRAGFSNVEIYELQQELDVPMDQVKAFLMEESRQGKIVLSLGDWSLSSQETRSGAIYLFDKPYLLVRFKE